MSTKETQITIEKAWESYRRSALSPLAPENQLRDVKAAFVAGCGTMLKFMSIDVPLMSETQRVATIQAVHEEVRQSLLVAARRSAA